MAAAKPGIILDQFGRPITSKPSSRAVSDLVRIRRPDPLSASTIMDVERLASTLRAADEGDISAYVELATEMEERDLHYFGQLSTRKLALIGKPVQAIPRDDSDEAKVIAEAFCETVLEDDAFPGLVADLMDGLGKMFSVVQAIWDSSRTPWGFSSFEHIPAECFTYIPSTGLQNPQAPLNDQDLYLILQDGEYKRLADLPGTYLLHRPRLRTGPTPRGGLARICARGFIVKNFSVKEYLAFLEVYGMPLRYATYDPDVITDEEKATIAIALANLGHDASAMIPRSVELNILGDAARTGQGDAFEKLCRYLDEQLSKAILGQTMTADNGSSKAQADVHNEVRIDYLRFDAMQLQLTLRHLAQAWTAVNYGPLAPVPRIRFAVDPPADMTSWTEAVLPWVSAGLKVSRSQVLDKLDLSEPEDEDDTIELTPKATGTQPVDPNAPAGGAPGAQRPGAKKTPGKAAHATTDALTGWDALMQPHVDQLEELAREHNSYEAFLEHLKLAPSNPLIERLVQEALAARLAAEGEE